MVGKDVSHKTEDVSKDTAFAAKVGVESTCMVLY
jgi:hypothetical protein